MGAATKYGRGQQLFRKDCGKCFTLRSTASVAKRCGQGETLPCKLHAEPQELSEGESVVWEVLQQSKAVEGCYVLHNDRLVKGTKSSADFALLCTRTHHVLLIVMVDGAQHLHRDMHGTTVAKQQAIDHRFDALANSQGIPVLRLHYKDMCFSKVWVEKAMQCARAGGERDWVMHSTKFTPLPSQMPTL